MLMVLWGVETKNTQDTRGAGYDLCYWKVSIAMLFHVI